MRFVIKVLGWAMILFAVAAVAAEIEDLRSGKFQEAVAGLVVILVFGGGGLWVLRAARRMKAAAPSSAAAGPSTEQRVLAAARLHQGKVTAVSVAADGALTIEQARDELERLARANACLMDVSADGLVVFRFPEFEASEPAQRTR
jgi:hypothetical protein